MEKPLITALVTLGLTVANSPTTWAQPSGHLGAVAGVSWVDADFAEGRQVILGITGDVAVRAWLDIDGDLLLPRDAIARTYTGTSVSFAPPGSSREEIERLSVVTRFNQERQTRSIMSLVATFHPPETGRRVTPRFSVGISSHRVRDRRSLEHLSLPPSVTLDEVNRIVTPEETQVRQIGGPSFGASLDIRLTPRLSVRPDVRYDYMSMGDEINNAVRSSVRLLYRF